MIVQAFPIWIYENKLSTGKNIYEQITKFLTEYSCPWIPHDSVKFTIMDKYPPNR